MSELDIKSLLESYVAEEERQSKQLQEAWARRKAAIRAERERISQLSLPGRLKHDIASSLFVRRLGLFCREWKWRFCTAWFAIVRGERYDRY